MTAMRGQAIVHVGRTVLFWPVSRSPSLKVAQPVTLGSQEQNYPAKAPLWPEMAFGGVQIPKSCFLMRTLSSVRVGSRMYTCSAHACMDFGRDCETANVKGSVHDTVLVCTQPLGGTDVAYSQPFRGSPADPQVFDRFRACL